jgi:predicted PurR-regulated permease PerM
VTLPIVAAAFFGPVGFIVAVLVAVLLLVGRGASHRER